MEGRERLVRGRVEALCRCRRPVKALDKARGLVQPQHQVKVLHGSTRSALAEIVEHSDKPRLLKLVGAEYIELHHVGAVQCFGLQRRDRGSFLERSYLHKALASISGRERRMQVFQL